MEEHAALTATWVDFAGLRHSCLCLAIRVSEVQSNTLCDIVTVALFLIAGFFMSTVSLRDEVLLVRGFVFTGYASS